MIYIFFGNDTKAKRAEVEKVSQKFSHGEDTIPLPASIVTKELLINYASGPDLFGNSPTVVLENFLLQGDASLLAKDLVILRDSVTLFIFLEDKLLAADQKKYEKYATLTKLQKLEEKAVKTIPTINIFAIADAFGRNDKIGAWTLYRQAIDADVEPEAISGILFWKIKTLILQNKVESMRERLQHQSSALVSIYHHAHQGKIDMAIGLEQFILQSLK